MAGRDLHPLNMPWDLGNGPNAAGHAIEIAREVRQIRSVSMASATAGPYDVMALVVGPDLQVMGEMVIKRIQGTHGAVRTRMNVVVE